MTIILGKRVNVLSKYTNLCYLAPLLFDLNVLEACVKSADTALKTWDNHLPNGIVYAESHFVPLEGTIKPRQLGF